MEPISPVSVRRFSGGIAGEPEGDVVAVEEPLEIRVEGRSVAVVMRTPGHDRELAVGLAFTEAIIRSAADIFDVVQCPGSTGNAVDLLLRKPGAVDFSRLTRNVFATSSCGICSKASIAALRGEFPPIEKRIEVSPEVLLSLSGRLAEVQPTFRRTGGLHACALFDTDGCLIQAREDVGRHNALDKLAGWAVLGNRAPLSCAILFLSGRVSFEMMQKALAMGVPVVAAISAPTSAAVTFARENGQTLAGFVRGDSLNFYAGFPGLCIESEVRMPVSTGLM